MPGPFGERGIVGKIFTTRGRRAPMRRHDQIEDEGLRRLHHAQVIAIEGLGHVRGVVDFFHGVGNGDGRHRCAVLPGGDDGAADQRLGQKRARRVVNEHDRGRAGCEGFKPGAHGRLPRRAAPNRRQKFFQARGRGAKHFFVLRMNDRLHGTDLRMTEKRRQRRTDHRLAGDVAILLGHVAASAQAPSARDDNSSD